jgi:PTH1 family peptidyl-tRNA hydrolase
MVVDSLAKEFARGKWHRDCHALVCNAMLEEIGILLVKPLTFMNRSGEALQSLVEKHRLSIADITLVLDDFNLPFGRIRIRTRGSAGGHNGLESVIRSLGTNEFVRVRLGIGDESMPEDKTDFVLEDFRQAQGKELKEMIVRAGDAVKTILSEGVSKAMSVYNASSGNKEMIL